MSPAPTCGADGELAMPSAVTTSDRSPAFVLQSVQPALLGLMDGSAAKVEAIATTSQVRCGATSCSIRAL